MLEVIGIGMFLVCGLLIGGVMNQMGQNDCVSTIRTTVHYGNDGGEKYYYTFYPVTTNRNDSVVWRAGR